ncbi:hypothetical protein [Chryseobacterium pennipullorum]|uniref:hypothetical protein n=1 Tax=Chryseobacterium pennipullorum TaxID=2258963 RepID=UPI000F4E1E19|nr:hypothetical protein [Chryseobacterium pennipullorum]
MNDDHDTQINKVHEIFHTLGMSHPKTKGGNNGIMKYPPEKPNQKDANTVGNGAFLSAIEKKKDE